METRSGRICDAQVFSRKFKAAIIKFYVKPEFIGQTCLRLRPDEVQIIVSSGEKEFAGPADKFAAVLNVVAFAPDLRARFFASAGEIEHAGKRVVRVPSKLFETLVAANETERWKVTDCSLSRKFLKENGQLFTLTICVV